MKERKNFMVGALMCLAARIITASDAGEKQDKFGNNQDESGNNLNQDTYTLNDYGLEKSLQYSQNRKDHIKYQSCNILNVNHENNMNNASNITNHHNCNYSSNIDNDYINSDCIDNDNIHINSLNCILNTNNITDDNNTKNSDNIINYNNLNYSTYADTNYIKSDDISDEYVEPKAYYNERILPVKKVDDNCSICLCILELNDPEIIKTVCDHEYHKTCLGQWARRKEELTCPLCRKDINYIKGELPRLRYSLEFTLYENKMKTTIQINLSNNRLEAHLIEKHDSDYIITGGAYNPSIIHYHACTKTKHYIIDFNLDLQKEIMLDKNKGLYISKNLSDDIIIYKKKEKCLGLFKWKDTFSKRTIN